MTGERARHLAAECRREAVYRRRVYGRMVNEDRMDAKVAQDRIQDMLDLAEHLEGIAQPTLFGEVAT